LKNLLEMQQKSGSSKEFLESVKVDLFPDEIYVFTPKGEIKKLPRGSTVVDFAYAVHTDVGNTCVAARIDNRMLPLSSKLYNGQTIEIISSDTSRPNPSWLDYVITAKARTNIRHFLKSLQTAEAESLGKRLLQQSINNIVGRDEAITEERLNRVLSQYSLTGRDELMAQIGLGNRNSSLVAKAMYDIEDDDSTAFDESGKPLAIKGTEGMVVSFAKCCRPVPGDAIIGHMSSGKGIVVHQQSCRNMTETSSKNRHLSVQWSEHVEGEYLAFLRVEVTNQRGVLANLATTIANASSNIEQVNLTEKDGRISTIEFVVVVTDRIHLARIMKKLRLLSVVIRISRK
jgi:guanosine-3',5'-bis(diphosphate) 3'-pyrophosphohydrolase